MNLLVIVLTILNVGCGVGSYHLLRSFTCQRLRRTVLDPATFVLMLSLIFLVDFLLLCFDSSSAYALFERHQSLSREVVIRAFGMFTMFQAVFFCSVAFSTWLPIRIPLTKHLSRNATDETWLASLGRPSDGNLRLFVLASLVLYLPCIAVYLWHSRGTSLSHQLLLRQNPLLDVVITLVVPMLAYYGTYTRRPNEFLLFAVICILSLTLAGKRGPVLAVGLITMACLYRFDITVPRKALWILCPLLVAFLLTQRFVFRESFRHDSISSFTQSKGGLLDVFFGTAEVSNAEVLSGVIANQTLLSRSPTDWLLSSALAPIPRSIATFKPWGGSAHATHILSPERWEFTRSEILVTGYGDLMIHFGTVGAFIVLFVMATLWSWSLRRTCAHDGDLNVFAYALLVWVFYVFMRGDAFNMSRHVWFYLIAWGLACLLVQTRLAIPSVRIVLPHERKTSSDR